MSWSESNNIEQSKRFYDAVFAAIGAKPGMQDEKGVNYRHNGAMLDGPAAAQRGSRDARQRLDDGFDLRTRPSGSSAWHDAGVAAGGTSIENPPGIRQGTFGKLYLAYLRDPDGNKLCGLHRLPAE